MPGALSRARAPRRAAASLTDQLHNAQARLDWLIRDASSGPLPHHEYDRQEGEAQAIADLIRTAYRGARP